MSQKSGCEEGLYDEKLQELKLKRPHSFFANYFTRKVRASTLCTSLASRHTRLYVVLNSMCFLIPFVQCSWLLFLTFPMIFSQNGHPITKRKSLAKPQNVQEDNAIHIDKIYCSKGVMQFTRKYRLLQVMSIKKRRKDWFQLLLLCKLKSHPQRSLVCHMILGQIRK